MSITKAKLVGIDNSFFCLKFLKDLNLSENKNLEKLTDEKISGLTALTFLDLSLCEKLGELPDDFGELSKLSLLNL